MNIKDNCYKGTTIRIGNEKRAILNKCVDYLVNKNFIEISIPIIQHQDIFKDKIGEENNNLMFNFKDRGNRELCLAPEYTSIIEQLTYIKRKLFYIQECFRGEKPQRGRYRQFTQLGVECLVDCDNIVQIALDLCNIIRPAEYEVLDNCNRGLSYYNDDTFEIRLKNDNISVCGGGAYSNGIGFAIGIDRLINI